MSGNAKTFGNEILILISFMNRAIFKKISFISFEEQFILFLKREKNKTDTHKSTKKRVIKRITMQTNVWRKSSNNGR